jgi:hypothetical protein
LHGLLINGRILQLRWHESRIKRKPTILQSIEDIYTGEKMKLALIGALIGTIIAIIIIVIFDLTNWDCAILGFLLGGTGKILGLSLS